MPKHKRQNFRQNPAMLTAPTHTAVYIKHRSIKAARFLLLTLIFCLCFGFCLVPTALAKDNLIIYEHSPDTKKALQQNASATLTTAAGAPVATTSGVTTPKNGKGHAKVTTETKNNTTVSTTTVTTKTHTTAQTQVSQTTSVTTATATETISSATESTTAAAKTKNVPPLSFVSFPAVQNPALQQALRQPQNNMTASKKLLNVYGYVLFNGSRLRAKPTTDSAWLAEMWEGDRVEVYWSEKGESIDGLRDWYYIKYVHDYGIETKGYVSATLVKITNQKIVTSEVSDKDFEAKLKQEGFPESYKSGLRLLHKLYPAWSFKALHCKDQNGSKVTWQRVLAYECDGSVSMVPKDMENGMKSYDLKDYDFKTDKFYEKDAGFVAAGREAVAYFLDPRNFLRERYIFQFEEQGYNADMETRELIASALQGTFMADGKKVRSVLPDGTVKYMCYPDIFLAAAAYSGASPLYLINLILSEVGSEGSGSVSGTLPGYEGYYNFYNIGAYGSANPQIKGLEYAKYGRDGKPGFTTYEQKCLLPWNNIYSAIVGGAYWVADGYINVGQSNSYLQKFDVHVGKGSSILTHQYQGNILAPTFISSETYYKYKENNILDKKHVFLIPVLAAMPDTPAPHPANMGSDNNYLKSITVTGGKLEQKFSPTRYNYTIKAPDDVLSLKITAKAYDQICKIKNTGTFKLKAGNNKIVITAVSERGNKRNYTITVMREKGGVALQNLQLTAGYICGFDVWSQGRKERQNTYRHNNMASYLRKSFSLPTGYSLEIKDAKGKVLSGSDLVSTGCTVTIHDHEGRKTNAYTVLVYGDINGDSKFDAVDLLGVKYATLGKKLPSRAAKMAADCRQDGKYNALDLLLIVYQILGNKKYIISQNP